MRNLYKVRGGENVMSMSKRMSVGLLSIIFLVALVSAMPVEAKKGFSTHVWWSEVWWTGSPSNPIEWTGYVVTDNGEEGTMYWDNHGAIFLGPDGQAHQKFWGEWWIDFDLDDGIVDILGTHRGAFDYAENKATINGYITHAIGDWSYLEGRRMHSVSIVDFVNFYIGYYLQIN
jgi:hypothetical protein